MYAVVVAMIPLGLAVAAGRRTRSPPPGSSLAFTYCELIDAALYLNHYWFVTLTFVLLAVLPTSGRATVPVLVVWILQAAGRRRLRDGRAGQAQRRLVVQR